MVDDSARRCALPGCDTEIEAVPGQPEPRYCTAAHRVLARQSRRAAAQAGGDEWLIEPAEPVSLTAVGGTGSPAGGSPQSEWWAQASRPRRLRLRLRGHSDRRVALRRRHMVVVLGAAGLLIGGYATVVSDHPAEPRETPVAQAPPVDRTQQEWAARTQIALASVNQQLDTIAQTEETWNRLPKSIRAGTPPVPVQRLVQRKTVLEQRKTMMQSQLAAYQSRALTTDELNQDEQYLTAVEKALADVPAPAQRSPEEAALVAQRNLRVRQLEAKREELRSLDAGVQSAARSPLPDDASQTTKVTGEVLGVVALVTQSHDGGRPPSGPTTGPRPAAVTGRDNADTRPRVDADTSGPPDPSGPHAGTGSAARPAAATPASGAGAGVRGAGRPLAPGAVAGPVAGGVARGPITGSVAAPITGSVAAPITGSVAAPITGSVAAPITGSVAAPITGSVAGRVAGSVTIQPVGPPVVVPGVTGSSPDAGSTLPAPRSLDAGVQSATPSPLPGDMTQTTMVSGGVLTVVVTVIVHPQDGSPPPTGPGPHSGAAQATPNTTSGSGNGSSSATPTQSTGTGTGGSGSGAPSPGPGGVQPVPSATPGDSGGTRANGSSSANASGTRSVPPSCECAIGTSGPSTDSATGTTPSVPAPLAGSDTTTYPVTAPVAQPPADSATSTSGTATSRGTPSVVRPPVCKDAPESGPVANGGSSATPTGPSGTDTATTAPSSASTGATTTGPTNTGATTPNTNTTTPNASTTAPGTAQAVQAPTGGGSGSTGPSASYSTQPATSGSEKGSAPASSARSGATGAIGQPSCGCASRPNSDPGTAPSVPSTTTGTGNGSSPTSAAPSGTANAPIA